MKEGARETYNKVQVDSRIPHLEDLEEAWLKWAHLAKELAALTVEVRQVSKLEAEVEGFRAIHEAEFKRLRVHNGNRMERFLL